MLKKQEIQGIISLLTEKYKSLQEPQFFFVNETVAARPYDIVIGKIEKIFFIKEDTDLNADVSFRYILTQGASKWHLQLSMLGAYAVIWRIVESGQTLEIIDRKRRNLSEVERELISVLEENNIDVLGEDILTYPVPLRLFYTEPEHTCIYQALFGDYDILPWQ